MIKAFSFSALIIGLLIAGEAHARNKSVYNEDSRRLVMPESSSLESILSRSVAVQIDLNKVVKKSSENVLFSYLDLSEGLNFCPEERFVDLPMLGDCSGFLIDKDTLMTAGHCMSNLGDCQNKVWAFDYNHQTSLYGNRNELSLSQDNIYKCREVVSYENYKRDGQSIDYAIIKLDRTVIGPEPLKVKRIKYPKISENLIMIGHPLGLPKMIVDNFSILGSLDRANSMINADSFSGNSGSPIIDLNSKMVVGMLIGGEVDFEFDFNSNCNRVKKCNLKTCSGERMQNYSAFPSKFIPLSFK
jgi:V8-like Glu-specific endopeptidase